MLEYLDRNVVKVMNGTFNVTLNTPIGLQRGTITFTDQNGVLSGSINAMGNTSYFDNGKADGNAFVFSGVLNTGLFKFKYTAKGTVVGDALQAVATSNSMTFQMKGTRVA
ncbi:MAG: hypothetical protein ABF449_07395 [Ethanoligenens sp.]|uniref:hypothetical protein n=1 Tax=Ethanoligenens sp. TaxID=2099655 RepID=UPI0039EB5116